MFILTVNYANSPIVNYKRTFHHLKESLTPHFTCTMYIYIYIYIYMNVGVESTLA